VNYYPFHIGDYLSATRHLSWEEDAAYRRLLDTYYTTEKPLPTDLRGVCRLVLATTDGQREAVRVVLEEFFALTDAGWVNGRADAEIANMRERQQKQRDKANKRWHKPQPEHGIAPAVPQHGGTDAAASETNANAMPPVPVPVPTPVPNRKKPSASSSARAPTIPCPYDQIVARYHERLPSLPSVRLMNDERQKAMRKFWGWVLSSTKSDGARRATTAEEAMGWIDAYFVRANDNDWLMGRGERSGTHAGWTADLDFLLTDKGKKHVIEKTKEAA
jgi:uncharacterized protein YdaU (DUF1376 family)